MQSNDLFILEAIDNLQYNQQNNGNIARGDLIHGNVYGEILDGLVKDYVSNMELRGLNYIWGKYDKALTEARRNNLEQSQQLLSEVEAIQAEYDPNTPLYALINVAALPMKAYLLYRNSAFKEAESLLFQAIENDIALIKDGFYILEYHRIQQLHNINRLHFKQGKLLEGASVIHQALRYILYEHLPAMSSDWSIKSLQQAPDSLRSAMFLQLSLEPIGVFLHHILQEKELFNAAFANLTFFEPRTSDEAVMLQWFEIKELFFKAEDNNQFLKEAIEFISKTGSEFDILKLSLIANISDALKKTSVYTIEYHQKIVAFSSQLKVPDRHKQVCLTYVSRVLES